jgi:L-rhamnose mutarotase
MLRKAFAMSVHPGMEAEYERRHSPVWPELETVLKEHGAHNYSIFLDPETGALFAYVEIEDEARWAAIAQTACCHSWWQSVKELMPSHGDGSPVARPLKEIFHLP